jgi:hypothetical protein
MYVPTDPVLSRHVAVLHELAKSGQLAPDDADREINAYLMAAANTRPEIPSKLLVMISLDAPSHNTIPDLGILIHRVLIRDAPSCALSNLLEQSIPCFRRNTRSANYETGQEIMLNVLLAMILGLYPGPHIRRPQFHVRVAFYARIHSLITASKEIQQQFCVRYENIFILACMEYIARILPEFMPAQNHAINANSTMSAFYRKVPVMCNQLRVTIAHDTSWHNILIQCNDMVERASRLKRCHRGAVPIKHTFPPASDICQAWSVPYLLGDPSPDDFRILGLSVGMPYQVLRCLQYDVQIHPLPPNLRKIQIRSFFQKGLTKRATYFATRKYMCCSCPPNQAIAKLRVDTIHNSLICNHCGKYDIMAIDLVGRVLIIKGSCYYYCPACTRVVQYSGRDYNAWNANTNCIHLPPVLRPKESHPCFMCHEEGSIIVDRIQVSAHAVDKGQMVRFYFCPRHNPPVDALRNCVNARQLANCKFNRPRNRAFEKYI